MDVRFAHSAEYDLAGIAEFIDRDDVRRAVTFLLELRDACRVIADHPKAYPKVFIKRGRIIRRKVFGDYLILFVVTRSSVVILHVVHARQDLVAMLDDLQRP